MRMSCWCLLFFLLSLFQTSCSFSPSPSPSPQLCLLDERSALLQLKQKHYHVSPYYNYHHLNSWNPDTDCCFWEGITCDGTTGHVVGLDLFNSSLHGPIHSNSTLFHLHHLQLLNLSWNSFHHFVPFGFDKLSSLVHLDLSCNHFSGQISSQLSQLTDLVSLHLSWNNDNPQLEIPNLGAFVQNLSNLRELGLDRVNLSAPKNREWCRHLSSALPKLQVLSMSECSLTGPLDVSISSLRFLSELYLYDNSGISSTVPASLMNLTSLTVLSLSVCGFYGDFPINVFLLPNLKHIDLWGNPLLSGYLPEFPQVNNTALQYLDVSGTKFQGKLPNSVGNLKFLKVLYVRGLNISGPIPPSLANLTHLTVLDLSFNSFIGQIPSLFRGSFPDLNILRLNNNLLQGPIHSYLFFSSSMLELDLSNNQFSGVINEPIHNISSFSTGRGFYLSGNHLKGQELMKSISKIKCTFEMLDLSFNDFSYLGVEDENPSHDGLSSNANDADFVNAQIQFLVMTSCNISKFPDFLRNQYGLIDLELSGNRLSKFPDFLRDLKALEILDLSNNQLSGIIPTCLTNTHFVVLNLESNKLHGPIPPTFKNGCKLQTLMLSKNMLHGKVPRSLGNCKELTVFDISDNRLNDTFPYWLENLSKLQVLVMRSNRFVGPIPQHPQADSPFQSLHVIDLSFNNFSGNLPLEYICQWKAMMFDEESSELLYHLTNYYYYLDTLEVMEKGLRLEMPRILTTFTTIDLSNNNFKGKIPHALGMLKALKVLNLSGNSLTGQIPFSFGNLSELESLDLSRNKLSGKIPRQLTSLTFLEVLNLSYNNFTGSIPQGNQFDTFSNTSYEGNAGLCGLPLSRKCGIVTGGPPTSAFQQEEEEDDSTCLLDWKFALAGYCSGVVIGLVIGQQLFWRKNKCSMFITRVAASNRRKSSRKIKHHNGGT